MNASIKTIKITSIIFIISLIIVLFMGSEYVGDTSEKYILGCTWATWQNITYGIFGSSALAALSAGIIYVVDKEIYLNKTKQYLKDVCEKSKIAFVQINEASKVLENKILSQNEKSTFTGISTIISKI